MRKLILFLFFIPACLLHAQQRDSRVREYIPPTRIVWQQHPHLISEPENLLAPGNGQADLANRKVCRLKAHKNQQPALLLDFGKELQGGLQLVTGFSTPNTPIKIRVRFGESATEAMSEIDTIHGATNDHAIRDQIITLPWLGVQEIGNSGFRFVRIDVLEEEAELQLKEVRAISTYRDIPYLGSFRSNDERLNRIWETGAYTVHVNMQEYLWDGIKRDRLVWVGDLHPEIMTVSTVFGHQEVVPKSLDLIRDITPLPHWMNGISSYSLWWLLIQRDWYYYHGDMGYLKEQQSYLTGLLRHLLTKFDSKGIETLDGNRFLDWPFSENKEAINAGLQALMIVTMQAGKELCTLLGETELADSCDKAAQKAIKASSSMVKTFKQHAKDPSLPGNKQAAALMGWAGMISPHEADQLFLSVNESHGFSTFYGYYMLRAIGAAGNTETALQIIRDYWGGMLDLGATTFWEDFDIRWLENAGRIDELVPEGKVDVHATYGDYCYKGLRHSLCHGWASGPTPFLSEYVLGIQVIEPGFKTIRIAPRLGDLQWVEGTLPTPMGIIKVRHEKQPNGSIKSSVDVPAGIDVIK